MNEIILSEWITAKKIPVDSMDMERIVFFVKYMDKHSLRLSQYTNSSFSFTNDADLLTFTFSEINEYVTGMKSGKAFPWKRFEENA